MLRSTSIRNRLFVAYVGILVVGFACLTVFAGNQIESAARQDFERRLVNEIKLISQGLSGYITDETILTSENTAGFDALIQAYEEQINGKIKIIIPPNPLRGLRDNPPEVQRASRGDIVVVSRRDEQGEETLYSAAPIHYEAREIAIAQIQVPVVNLQGTINQRWAVIWSIFAVVTLLALTATYWISHSIIQPLMALRDSANRLSQGDFAHRVEDNAHDEIGVVARAFNHMAQQVESMLEEQRAFASNTSHELRTPLTSIRLRSEALRDDDELDAETRSRYVQEIDDEVVRLAALVEDLTILSRFDAGRAEIGDSEIDMLRFATNMVQADEDVVLELPDHADVQPVRASLNHLTIVFRNLLDNAHKYSPDGKPIIWAIQVKPDGIEHVIRDEGQGIEPEHLPHLFERFYRADKARSRNIPGTGLGLALVKSILDAYGASITIESDGKGHGTVIKLVWPYGSMR